MTPGSCTCSGCLACIRPDEECGFTGPCSHADVEPKSKCYGVSPGVRVHRLPCLSPPILASPAPPPAYFPTCCAATPLPRPVAGAAASPAGPCLFISSEAAMINETLNTSSLFPGPGEPHSWVNRPGRGSTPPQQSRAWVRSAGNPPSLPSNHPTTGRNSRDLSELCCWCSDISQCLTRVRDPTKSHLGASGWGGKTCRPHTAALPERLSACGTRTRTHTQAPYLWEGRAAAADLLLSYMFFGMDAMRKWKPAESNLSHQKTTKECVCLMLMCSERRIYI